MSLGLPAHLARNANARALAAASRVAAMVCLAAAAASILAPGLLYGAQTPWWALLSLLPMAALLLALHGRRTVAFTVAYLLVGAGATFVYTVALLTQTSSYRTTELIVVALPVVALTLVGGTGTGAFAGVLWATIGFLLGETAVFLAAVTAAREFHFDGITLGAYVFLALVLAFDGLTRNAKRGAQALILRTMREEQAAAMRQNAVAEAAGELHDTTLSQLLVIAGATPGPISPELRTRLADDLARWGSGRVSIGSGSASVPVDADALWRQSELGTAVEEARDSGLSIDVTGDRSVLMRLDREHIAALGAAVRQCLVNVLRHSGVLNAEVVISATHADVSVMVVDGGHGFDEGAIADERLGLRHSVRGRIERVGGSVTVFSNPGAGTSVLIRLPVGSRSSRSTPVEDEPV